MGLTTGDFGEQWEESKKYLQPAQREQALRKLGLYDGPKLEDQDLGYLQRMKDFKETDWVEEYYKDDNS
jgi:hypothetical protein